MLKQLHKLFSSLPQPKILPQRKASDQLALVPEDAMQAKQKGDDAFARSDLQEAEQHYRYALSLHPQYAKAHNSLGLVLDGLERFGEAVDCYLKAVQADPSLAAAYLNLSNWHRAHGSAEEQLRYLETALSINPDYYDAHNNLGSYFHANGESEKAEACFRRALSIKPEHVWTLLNMAICCRDRGDHDGELEWLEKAMAADPGCAAVYSQFGFLALEKGDLDAAEMHYRKALACDPQLERAQFNLGTQLLAKGNFEEGLALFEARFKLYPKEILGYDTDYFPVACRAPRWDGANIEGKTILLWLEQGLGDNLMMIRYLPELLKKACGKIVVCSRPSLTRIFRHLPYPVEVIETEEELLKGTYDFHCPMTSLPFLLKTREETIPRSVPYIFVPEDLKRSWRERLAPLPGLKVGLVWAGNNTMARDALRSVAFWEFERFGTIPGISFVSLQKGESANQGRNAKWLAQDYIEECSDFLDTAALVEHLDLVISVDTSTVHLSGALGKPVWLLNRFESEWRWMMEREDSPWYPTVRIFRQPARHDWTSVVMRMASELTTLVRAEGVAQPASPAI